MYLQLIQHTGTILTNLVVLLCVNNNLLTYLLITSTKRMRMNRYFVQGTRTQRTLILKPITKN